MGDQPNIIKGTPPPKTITGQPPPSAPKSR
jgi:hypothetical protein